ncbi:MAG: hypothetical protein LBH95_04690 [Oscillospiraceae bacterium]|nr:hypothetical protein [Oscillospiraceae bacterium]
MKRYKQLTALTLALCVILPLAACDGDWLLETPPVSDAPSVQGAFAPPEDGGVAALLSQGENEEGVLSGGEQFGAGFAEMSGEGEFDPDKKAGVSKNARPVRRIVKQDVYGNVLPDAFYYYRNMLSESERKVYDQIYANAAELDPYFELTTKVSRSRITEIVCAVRYDNPDLFWLDHLFYYTYDGSGYVTSMTLTFFKNAVANIGGYKRNFYNCADSILEYAMTFDNEIDMVKVCHDILTHINAYEWADMNQSAYSALCTGKSVCAGYSFAFLYLMQRLGIPCVSLYGYTGEDHLWNMVCLDGDWYEMDVTWDDPIGNPSNIYYYNYFNITTRQMGNRRRYAISSPLPQAGGTYYSYYNYYGYSPGTNLVSVKYGYPKSSLPPVYPASAPDTVPSDPAKPSQPQSDYSVDEIFSGENEEAWSCDEVEEWLMSLTDEEWIALWDVFMKFLDDDEMEFLDELDWDEFVDLMYAIMN